MNDGRQTAPTQTTSWKWLRTLTLVLWADLALSVVALASGLLVAEHGREFYPIYMSLFGISSLLMMVFLLAAPILILLHAVALVKHRESARAAYFGMVSGAIGAVGILVLMGYAETLLG